MDMTIILKIAAVGLIVAVLQQILAKLGRDEYGMLLVLTGIVVILMMLVPQLLNLLETVQGALPI
ncbi:MAG: stage III sporulation protein AC [Oscillospiraceae bacterium]|jgi:stage III sporulation protein AC|nr:stage III sporulation protein AC [Oscillospiraceae bacterium]